MGIYKFNYLINTLTLSLTCGDDLIKSMFNSRTFGSNSMLNHHLSQKVKLIRRGKFNNLINTLTVKIKRCLNVLYYFVQ